MMTARTLSQNSDIAMLDAPLERYFREHYSFEARRALLKSNVAFHVPHWNFLAESGFLALPFREEDGGLEGSLADVMSVMGRIGRALFLEPYLQCIVLGSRLLGHATASDERSALIEGIIAGRKLVGLAHLEPGDRARGEVRRTVLTKESDRIRLRGCKILVPIAQSLDAMLVTARDENGELNVLVVPTASPGISIRSYRTADGHCMADVELVDVVLPRQSVLDVENVDAALEDSLTYMDAAVCAEIVGCMQSLLDMTAEHLKTRKQFGRPIGSFQVLKHRLVDCYAGVEQAVSMLEMAATDTGPDWKVNVAAARAFISEQARCLGHEAIQMHGGMGLTDELAVSHFHKRILVASLLFGSQAEHIDRYLEARQLISDRPPDTTAPLQQLLSAQEQAFHRDVRTFLDSKLSAEVRKAVRRQTSTYPEKHIFEEWRQALNEQGWLAPHWPREHGGTGWTAVQRFLFEYESAVAGAPEQIPMGYRYVGPVIAHFGSEWQKSYFLPRLLTGEHFWAQGFSEPAAGSDLAAIKTAAVLDGDHYVINGTKMWTTDAHLANWMFCLARTERTDKPQQGISFFLIDMHSPGVKVEPIALLAVDHEVNTVFLTDVHVPVANLVGQAGQGWDYVKFLLDLERGGSIFCGRIRYEFNRLRELAATAAPRLREDRVLMHRLASLEHRLLALEMLEFQGARAMGEGAAPGIRGSLTKLLGSELQKDITEMAVAVAAHGSLELVPVRPLPGAPPLAGTDLEAVAMPRYLNLRAASIYGGSSEVQREIISKHIFGLR
jgi:alkylation response protein AidB-like acyl-CoA dehydrogenase